MDKRQIKKIFTLFQKNNPNPKTELLFNTPFELLVAVILSAQATDVGVNRATQVLFPVANTPEQFLALGQAGLEPFLQRLNLYRNKTKYLLATAAKLIAEHKGQVPSQRAELEALPGVGRKTANVILNTLFNEATIAVDTHIFRVSQRIGLAQGKTPEAVEQSLLEVVPKSFLKDAHHWLVLHGRYVCKARKPLCGQCLIQAHCHYPCKMEA